MQLPDGLIAFGSKANCTLDLCPVEASILTYQPSIAQNVAIIALFFVSMLIHIGQGIRWRSWDFMSMVCIGVIDEIIGYGGRLLYNKNPFSFNAFLIQIVCITTAPVFFCSAIYVLLSRTITHLDRSVSRFNPKFLVWTFIPSDLVSLVLQALGGALSATQASSGGQTGVKISKAGLIIQVITLTIFLILFIDYVVLYQLKSKAGSLSTRFKIFLSFLFLSIIFIFIRCGFRVKELQEGYKGEAMHDEKGFMVLEAGMMVLAVYCLNVAHPGIAFRREVGGKTTAASSFANIEEVTDMPNVKRPSVNT
ncbi:parasitic phase-specific protein PSP-1 [Thozetella sp. PMI_491]|nr:parasitic phase-specific protein PSP-1 [Thozetella sp. PMI_491]